ncbi:hypothetical protein KFL_000220420 [Klebsormidium nitens]|uniref:AB hydrolase-1 domain-containing protein n=1 Tax=Klebsormidium nitens TaxID=105231 RepID=A0A1Y1HKA5_KLENI|nr:hypothetical protein KFL_000220420 [Klebsormidium nitens]|eukprot:GAQ79010.1 hypothetical protein KFL_000220420 [Klebsormidium nitens]
MTRQCQQLWGGRGQKSRVGRLQMGKDDYYLVDADLSYGDGFSFAGGMYSQEPGPYEEWQERGKIVEAYALRGAKGEVKDPIFGLKMGENSQTGESGLRWFYVEEGEESAPPVVLLHGVPSQAYSYRKVLPILAEAGYRVIAPDWLGFGFSDKPQPGPSFSYGLDEYQKALGSFLDALSLEKVTLVAQGHLAPAAIRWATSNPDRVERLVLLNAPVTSQHAKLPGALSTFSTFLLGEVFAQDPIKASDSTLNSCGPYVLDEQDAMVYRRPYLTAGMAGFALTAVTRALNKELKGAIEVCQKELARWSVPTTLMWGRKDYWLKFDGVQEFARSANVPLVELDQVGHHAQEDYGEVVGEALRMELRRQA